MADLAGKLVVAISSRALFDLTESHRIYTELVKRALEDGYAAATIFPSAFKNETDELRIAFDGDAVLFSDEAERVYQSSGLAAFAQSERDAASTPLSGGPFKEFLAALHRIQADFPEDRSPIRTALVTA